MRCQGTGVLFWKSEDYSFIMKVSVYNQEGKEAGQVTLPKQVFEVQMNADLVHQVFVSHTSNMRQNSAHTKNRGEVRGGGRKPWRQKGTGRARHGSTRSPIWVGGGVSGGPRNERNFEREIPKKMRKKAMCMVLSQKVKDNLMVVLEDMKIEPAKTKVMAALMAKLPSGKKSTLVLYAHGNKNIHLIARNIAKAGVQQARNVNIVDLLNHQYVIASKDAIKEIEQTLGGESAEK